jgi:hypothetical protein
MTHSQKYLMEYRTNKVLSHIGLSVGLIRKFLTPVRSWNKEVIEEIAMWSTIAAVFAYLTIQHVYAVEIISYSL